MSRSSKRNRSSSGSHSARGVRSLCPNSARPLVEFLQSRRLLSASLNPISHTLTVTGTADDDAIYVSQNSSWISVLEGRNTTLFATSQVAYIVINGQAGHDSLKLSATVTKAATINGGDGDDVLVGGAAADVFNGGNGEDTVDYTARATDLNISLDNAANDGNASGEGDNVKNDVEIVKGGTGNDSLLGNAGNNEFHGYGGNDIIEGGDGDDALYGGTRYYRLVYPEGDIAWKEIDAALSTGNDIVLGQDGADTVVGSATGDCYLYGGADDDLVIGRLGTDYLHGSGGNDTLCGQNHFEDPYDPGIPAGDDYLSGGDGHDLMSGGWGNDAFWGGAGTDQVTYMDKHEYPEGCIVSLDDISNDSVIGSAEADNVHTDVEDVHGTDYGDVIYGSSAANKLIGARGDDYLFGLGGSDYLEGNNGEDNLYGSDGDDTLIGGHHDDVLWGEAGNDFLSGSDLFVSGHGFADLLIGGDGNDVLNVADGDIADYVEGGDGYDIAYVDFPANGAHDIVYSTEEVTYL